VLDAVVTGAGGFIGRALCCRLANDGWKVQGFTTAHGDVRDAAFWEGLPAARALVHLAARSFVPDSWKLPTAFVEANVLGTQLALDWCVKHNARIVFASAYVYGIPSRLPVLEYDPVLPNNPYALSKALAEQCVEFAACHSGVNATILRIFNVYGAGQREEFLVPTLIKQLHQHEIRVMDLAPRRDYVYIDDVVEAFVRAIALTEGFHRFNIGSGCSHSVGELIDILQSVARTSLPVVSNATVRCHEIPEVRADISLARDLLEWTPACDLETGIRNTLRMLKYDCKN